METFAGILLFGGAVLIFAGMVEYMFRSKAGPPPNGCGLLVLFIFGTLLTKIGRIGAALMLIGALLMSLT